MDLSFDDIRHLDPVLARRVLPPFLATHVDVPQDVAARIETGVAAALAAVSDDDLRLSLTAFFGVGDAYAFYPADETCRAISRAFVGPLLAGSEVVGLDNLRMAASDGPTLLLSNHLSYVDTQVLDVLLAQWGAADLSDRLVAVAGPKVYDTPFKRIAAMALGTLKTAQSTSLSHNAAALSLREVARIAVLTIQQASHLMAEGHLVVLYAEGARSRSGRLQPFLAGARKYTRNARWLVPVAGAGTESVFPVGAKHLRASPVRLAFGEPVPAGVAGAVDACWHAIANGLPEPYRPS